MVFGIINLVKKEINSVNFTFYDMSGIWNQLITNSEIN